MAGRRGWLTALACKCRGWLLGRSDWDYLKQHTGNDVYWDHMLAAERRSEK